MEFPKNNRSEKGFTITVKDPDITVSEVLLAYRRAYPDVIFSLTDVRYFYGLKSIKTVKRRTIHISKFLRYCGSVYNVRRRIRMYSTVRDQLLICGIQKVYVNVQHNRNPILYIYLSDRDSLYEVHPSNMDRAKEAVENMICDAEEHKERWI